MDACLADNYTLAPRSWRCCDKGLKVPMAVGLVLSMVIEEVGVMCVGEGE